MKIRRMKKAIPVLLATALLLLSFGCGWDNTPQYVIASAAPSYTPFARWTPSPIPEDYETPTPEPTHEPADSAQPSGSPDGTASASAAATPDAGSTQNPSVTPTPDPYLFGKWEFKRSRYKGKELSVSETKQRMILWLFSNGSAEMNIYEISATSDPPENTKAVQWRITGSKLTMTLYGETILTLVYDGTYLILEQEVDGAVDEMIFEKTGE